MAWWQPAVVIAGGIVGAACGRVAFDPRTGGAVDGAADGLIGIDGPVKLGPFNAPVLVSELEDPVLESASPTVSEDELEIFFGRRMAGLGANIFVARRTSVALPWGTPQVVTELNSPDDDAGMNLGRNGLTFMLASTRTGGAGGHDIYETARTAPGLAFAAPTRVVELSTSSADVSATRDATETYLVTTRGPTPSPTPPRVLLVSRRAAPTASWDPPVALAGAFDAAADNFGPQLSADGLTLYFASDATGTLGGADLWMTTRSTIDEPFGQPQHLVELNSQGRESSSWVSADNRVIYFVSDRSGRNAIYRASR